MALEPTTLSDGQARKPMTAGRALVAVLVAGACGVGLLWYGLPEAWLPVGQWDFDAYYYALKVKDAGGNPWDHAEVIKAAGGWVSPPLYPPRTLEFFRLFAFDDIRTAKLVFLAAKLCCLAALFAVWLTVFVRPGARGWDAAGRSAGWSWALPRRWPSQGWICCGRIALLLAFWVWAMSLRRQPGAVTS